MKKKSKTPQQVLGLRLKTKSPKTIKSKKDYSRKRIRRDFEYEEFKEII